GAAVSPPPLEPSPQTGSNRGPIGGVDIMDPVNIVKGTIAAVDEDASSIPGNVSRPALTDPAEQRLAQQVRIGRLVDLMDGDVVQAAQVLGGAVRHQMDRMTASRQMQRQGVVGPVHAAGLDEVTADQQIRFHVAQAEVCPSVERYSRPP